MNQDLKPFYETAHKIYQELLTGDNIPYKKVFNPSIFHENQFHSLLNVLIKIGLIINRINIESLIVTGIDKGESFTEYKNWMPSDTSAIDINRNEYYLLYLRYNKLNVKQYPFAYKSMSNGALVYYIPQILSNSEIFKFSLEINKGNGRHFEIRNQTFYSVIPDRLAVYDLSKLSGYHSKFTREGFQELLNQTTSGLDEIDEKKLLGIGENVTSKLGYILEDIKLSYFETYYRLTHFFPEFEELLLNELSFPQKRESQSQKDILVNKNLKNIGADVNSESDVNGSLAENVSEELDEHRTLFKYGLYFPAIKDDQIEPCFKVKTVASVFADHISKLQEETGQMVGIFGKWGRGKTYLKKEVEGIFKNENSKYNFTIIDFHAWKYQDTPAIWAYLYECLSDEYFGSQWVIKNWRKFKLNFQREKSNIIKIFCF